MSRNLSRKYRPDSFDKIIGQNFAVGSIKAMLTDGGSLPGTILLSGPHSTGKTTLSRLIALAANCESLDGADACRSCSSCKSLLGVLSGEGTHPDVVEINAASERGIDMIRNLKKVSKFRPRNRYRVFILDEAHAVTAAAFQAALKLFEEPPASSRFILCTTDPEKLPKTIRSRCQRFDLRPISPDETAKLLADVAKQEEFPLSEKLFQEIANQVQGHPREALNILDQVASYAEKAEVTVEMLPSILAESAEFVPYLAVQKYLKGLFSARYKLSFTALYNSPNHEYLVGQVLEGLQQVLRRWVRVSADAGSSYLLREVHVPDPDSKKMADMADLLDIYSTAQERVKTYLADPVSVIGSATIRAIQITKKWEQ